MADGGAGVDDGIHAVLLPPVASGCEWVAHCDVGRAIHHIRITDCISQPLVVVAAGQLQCACTFEAPAITRSGVAEVGAVFVGVTRGKLEHPAEAAGFMAHLREEVPDSDWCGDIEPGEAGVEISELGVAWCAAKYCGCLREGDELIRLLGWCWSIPDAAQLTVIGKAAGG